MSTSRRSTQFKCGNDCRQMGCPGHTLTIIYHHVSDTVSVVIDEGRFDKEGQKISYDYVFDEHMFHVLCNLANESR